MVVYLLVLGIRIWFVAYHRLGWSGGAVALGKLPVPGRPTIGMIVGQGPIALAVGKPKTTNQLKPITGR